MKDFREVKVWQNAHRLTMSVYRATAGFDGSGSAVLTDDMKRSCAALSSNLFSAKLGVVRGIRADPEFTIHMHGALRSAAEIATGLELARDLDLLPESEYRELEQEVTALAKTITSFLRTFGAERYRVNG